MLILATCLLALAPQQAHSTTKAMPQAGCKKGMAPQAGGPPASFFSSSPYHLDRMCSKRTFTSGTAPCSAITLQGGGQGGAALLQPDATAPSRRQATSGYNPGRCIGQPCRAVALPGVWDWVPPAFTMGNPLGMPSTAHRSAAGRPAQHPPRAGGLAGAGGALEQHGARAVRAGLGRRPPRRRRNLVIHLWEGRSA